MLHKILTGISLFINGYLLNNYINQEPTIDQLINTQNEIINEIRYTNPYFLKENINYDVDYDKENVLITNEDKTQFKKYLKEELNVPEHEMYNFINKRIEYGYNSGKYQEHFTKINEGKHQWALMKFLAYGPPDMGPVPVTDPEK
jgi:hypothetical protein